MSAKTICLDATKIEKNSRMDNRERRCPTSLLSLSSLSRLLLSLDIGAGGAQGGDLPQALLCQRQGFGVECKYIYPQVMNFVSLAS